MLTLRTRIGLGVAFTAALLVGVYGPGSPATSPPPKPSTNTYTCHQGSPDRTEAFNVNVDGRTIVCYDN